MTEKEFFVYLQKTNKKELKIQMEKVNTYMVSISTSPMGYAGAPAADYDCSGNGIGMHKLEV